MYTLQYFSFSNIVPHELFWFLRLKSLSQRSEAFRAFLQLTRFGGFGLGGLGFRTYVGGAFGSWDWFSEAAESIFFVGKLFDEPWFEIHFLFGILKAGCGSLATANSHRQSSTGPQRKVPLVVFSIWAQTLETWNTRDLWLLLGFYRWYHRVIIRALDRLVLHKIRYSWFALKFSFSLFVRRVIINHTRLEMFEATPALSPGEVPVLLNVQFTILISAHRVRNMVLVPCQIILWSFGHWLAKKYLMSYFFIAASNRKEILKVAIFDLFHHSNVPRFGIQHFLCFLFEKFNCMKSFFITVEIQSLNQKAVLTFPDFDFVLQLLDLNTLVGEWDVHRILIYE
jgi:hypothetical protein